METQLFDSETRAGLFQLMLIAVIAFVAEPALAKVAAKKGGKTKGKKGAKKGGKAKKKVKA